MRILHTSDWHLGHTLHDVPRDHEHAHFLAWLTDTLQELSVDALIIAGDVFDSANPPASAQARWYRFLADVRARMPALDVVVIGGNHDSAARLDAPVPLLEALRIHVVGGLPRHPAATARGPGAGGDTERAGPGIAADRLIIPLTDRDGGVAAHIAAVPFLRPSDLPRPARRDVRARPEAEAADQAGEAAANTGAAAGDAAADVGEHARDPLIEGVRAVYAEVLAAARARCLPSQALIATGHCYMVGSRISALSERRILGGNQHALPVDIFPEDVTYAALGHMHKAQRVAGLDRVRYPGSPLSLAMSEARYRHQVLVVELAGATLRSVESVPVPRTVDLLRVPRFGAAPLGDVLHALQATEDWDGVWDPASRPYLEVCVALERPEVNLRQLVEAALVDKRPRLLKLSIEYTGTGLSLADAAPEMNLRDLDPGEVFLRRYQRDHEEDPEPELVAAFHELLDQVSQEGAT